MKNLNLKEFNKRFNEVAKARKIFIPHITKNITIAFQLYQEIFAEEQMAVTIGKINTPFGDIERPRCDECDTEMQLNPMPKQIGDKIYPSTWICPKCKIEEYTEKTVEQWYEELRKDKE